MSCIPNKSIKGCGELLGKILRSQANYFPLLLRSIFLWSHSRYPLSLLHYFPSDYRAPKFSFDYSSPLVIRLLQLPTSINYHSPISLFTRSKIYFHPILKFFEAMSMSMSMYFSKLQLGDKITIE